MAQDDQLADKGAAAVQLQTQAELGSIECSFSILRRRDAWLRHSDSAETARLLLARLTTALRACLKSEGYCVANGRECSALGGAFDPNGCGAGAGAACGCCATSGASSPRAGC